MSDGPIERPLPLIGELAAKVYRGEKTMTRRPISALNSLVDNYPSRKLFERLWLAGAWVDPGPSPAGNVGPYLRATDPKEDTTHRVYSRVQPGDRFWIREPTLVVARYGSRRGIMPERIMVEYADGTRSAEVPWPDRMNWNPKVAQKIPNGCIREAARTVVTVTAVRPERVQSITEEDALAEGVVNLPASLPLDKMIPELKAEFGGAALRAFRETIQRLYPGLWEKNGWCWVYSWEAHKP